VDSFNILHNFLLKLKVLWKPLLNVPELLINIMFLRNELRIIVS